jgi:hypothetical protein
VTIVWIAIAVAAVVLYVGFRYRKKPTFSFFFIIILLAVVGIALLFVHFPFLQNDEFPHSLGHAFIIAAFLAGTVDQFVKERVLREVTLDVSKYLVGYRLPEEIQNRIRELMQTKFIRRKFEVRCKFEETQGGNKLKADIIITDELQNITSEALDYTDTLEFERHETAKVHELKCHSDDISASYRFDVEQLRELTVTNDTHVTVSGKGIIIPPIAESVGRVYRFQSRYIQQHPIDFSENITFKQPTIGVSVEITDYPPGFSFFVTPKADIITHLHWQFTRLFLPGEHITITWKRNSSSKRSVK